jgi:hypothetical protein
MDMAMIYAAGNTFGKVSAVVDCVKGKNLSSGNKTTDRSSNTAPLDYQLEYPKGWAVFTKLWFVNMPQEFREAMRLTSVLWHSTFCWGRISGSGFEKSWPPTKALGKPKKREKVNKSWKADNPTTLTTNNCL